MENPVQHDHSKHGEGEDDHSESEKGQSSGEETAASGATSFNMQENGNWSWNIEQNAVTAVQENFQWLSGSTETVTAEAVQTEDGHAPQPGSIGLKLNGSGTFLLQKMSVTKL